MVISVAGCVKNVTIKQGKTAKYYRIECNGCNGVCYSYDDQGNGPILGLPCPKVAVTNPDNIALGQGFTETTVTGNPIDNDMSSGLDFDVTPATVYTNSYDAWIQSIPTSVTQPNN